MTNLQWDDNHPLAQYGDGISHPKKGARTKLFKLLVRNSQMSAMKVELKAESKRDAIRYATARWPGAVIDAIR